MLRMWGFLSDLIKWGIAYFETIQVPRPLTWCIKSYFLTVVTCVSVKLIAEAILGEDRGESGRSEYSYFNYGTWVAKNTDELL